MPIIRAETETSLHRAVEDVYLSDIRLDGGCMIWKTNAFLISRDVVFCETIFPYANMLMEETNNNPEIIIEAPQSAGDDMLGIHAWTPSVGVKEREEIHVERKNELQEMEEK